MLDPAVLLPVVVVTGLIELLSSLSSEPTDKSLMSEDMEATEFRKEPRLREEICSFSCISTVSRSILQPASPPSCREIILMPIVWPVLAGMKIVVVPF